MQDYYLIHIEEPEAGATLYDKKTMKKAKRRKAIAQLRCFNPSRTWSTVRDSFEISVVGTTLTYSYERYAGLLRSLSKEFHKRTGIHPRFMQGKLVEE